MTMRMLIDARHREETRVAVVKGNRIEEFDFESAERKQLKGNIYLAKVTRVEPSLQAAFVDYGGNRHGFLAFSEIHPDYYQIPKEDRDALLAEEAEHAAEEAALRAEEEVDEDGEGDLEVLERPSDEDEAEAEAEDGDQAGNRGGKRDKSAVEALRQRRMSLRKRYKIQDVIRRRQVLLVQVVKEERGNKGAALTTYLSLAGRYCVLMPNTAHGGGISRKISSAADRKRLKTIMAEMKLPPTMGCIVRTAGLQRTKTEIKRDFDYLARLWDGIREATLKSTAPCPVYGDSDLIKRAIRDIYNRDIGEVIVEGEDGYRQAKDFMKLLMPSHARRVKQYSDAVPLFQRHHVEDQLGAMYHPVVQLKSGGYLVINPTEALVSIDINSGRSTREHNIEQTATATNLEAAQEIARQLRLRDMAGLVVIDFIDMDHSSNVRKVEKAMKEALKADRARIQVGRISAFGLMEMSRQRLRTGVLEASTRQCPHCEGTGLVRTASSAGLSALRLIEDEAARGRGSVLTLRASQEAAFYVLNKKRADIAEIEERYGVSVEIVSDGEIEGARMSVEASGPPPAHAPKLDQIVEYNDDDLPEETPEEEETEAESHDEEGEGARRRRRRRRGRRNRGGPGEEERDSDETSEDGDEESEQETAESAGEEDSDDDKPKRRRRGRRGGRRNRGRKAEDENGVEDRDSVEQQDAPAAAAPAEPVTEAAETPAEPESAPEAAEAKPKRTRRRPKARTESEAPAEVSETVEAAEEKPKPKRTRRKKKTVDDVAADADAVPPAKAEAEAEAKEAPNARGRGGRRKKAETEAETVEQDLEPAAPSAPAEEADAGDGASAAVDGGKADADEEAKPRRGWWQRTFG
ncbi:Rne/Rng family ribonuclease [Stakelama saccharophila]|uniref:Ribonuclease E n=1 Tax=Stakelama saccharophila TaxID=3075605 RepID=A0ABZ0BD63_9SPHN|nr:ribonuclease E/G [Stakelama sp. W311]WNO54234.1 ribonuclease E/G [Stakelama sp. W311]